MKGVVNMSEDVTFNISIPSDSDGFVLLQCSLCGEFFKMTPTDFEDDSQLHIWCPNCGLNPDSLITEEVFDIAMKIAISNYLLKCLIVVSYFLIVDKLFMIRKVKK